MPRQDETSGASAIKRNGCLDGSENDDSATPLEFFVGFADNAFIKEETLARHLGRHVSTLRRAVERGELPPSIPMAGRQVFSVERIRAHLARRFEAAEQDMESSREVLARNRPGASLLRP